MGILHCSGIMGFAAFGLISFVTSAPASGAPLRAAGSGDRTTQLTIEKRAQPLYYGIALTANPLVICTLKCNPLNFGTEIQFVNTRSGAVVSTVRFKGNFSFGYIRFAKSRGNAAYGTMSGNLYLLKARSPQPVLFKQFPRSMPPIPCWSSDGKLLTAAIATPMPGHPSKLQVKVNTYEVATRNRISQIGPGYFGGIAPDKSEGYLIAKGSDVYGYLPPSSHLHRDFHTSGGLISGIIPVDSHNMVLVLQNTNTGTTIKSFGQHGWHRKWTISVRYSAPYIGVSQSANLVAVLRQTGRLTLFNLNDGTLIRVIRLPQGEYASGMITSDGNAFYGLEVNGTVTRLDMRSLRIRTVHIHNLPHR